jgi:hypothetical protein
MGQKFKEINQQTQAFIEKQKIFFVGTAAAEGKVNISPKGMNSFRVMDKNRVIWLNVTGSGNETAAHVKDINRMTIMFCAFEGTPLILRLYGQVRTIHPNGEEWEELSSLLPKIPGARQIFDVKVDMVQHSCGMAVPLYEYQDEREELNQWAEKKGDEGIKDYWEAKNQVSLDGKDTGIFS